MARRPRRRSARSSGRPRDAAIDRAIIDATLSLLRKRPYARVGLGAIAAAAGVSRQALYRRFASKEEALLAALATTGAEAVAVRPSASLSGDVARFMAKTFAALLRVGPPMRALVAQAQADEKSRTLLRERLIATRRTALRGLIERHAPDAGPERVELALDLAFGAMWYRFLVEHAPLSARLARELGVIVGCVVRDDR